MELRNSHSKYAGSICYRNQSITTNGGSTSQRRISDRVQRRQQTLDQNPEFKEAHEVVCVDKVSIV